MLTALAVSTITASAEPRLQWRVKNNFTLMSNEATQERFASDLEAYLRCMKQAYNPLGCPQSHRPGLAERPYALRFTPKTLSYREAMLWPSSGEQIKDRVTIRASIDDAPNDATCQWSVDGERLIDGPCDTDQLRVRLYDPDTEDGRKQVYQLAVTLRAGGKETTFKDEIRVRRRIVVAMGDSLVSGEGNPIVWSRPNAEEGGVQARDHWLEKRCHRSLLSAAGLAAWRLAASGKELVAFINVACSGSTAWHIPRTAQKYDGVETAQAARNEDASRHYTQTYMLAQIDEVKKAFCGLDQPCAIRPDVIVLSVGINDLGFGSVVRRLTLNSSGTPPASMTRDAEQRLDHLRKDPATPGSLLHAYRSIQTSLTPRNVLVVEYPDPGKDDSGTYCNASPLFSGLALGVIDSVENKWADDTLLKPLNAAVDKAVTAMAADHPAWRVVGGVVAATAKHGYCANKSHFNMGQDAKVDSGTLHPNVVGHDAIADLVHKQMLTVLGN